MTPGRGRGWLLVLAAVALAQAGGPTVVLDSDGWRLVGDWRQPEGDGPFPAALLLHRAAGSRAEYVELADALAQRGIASLRLDLRANGESTNLGRFREPYAEHLHLNEGAHRDVGVALSWMAAHSAVDPDRLAVVSASYSGEVVGEALRAGGSPARAYVSLSPGNFSEESIDGVEASGRPWLFLRTVEESPVSRPFLDELFALLAERAPSAELRTIEGAGHATRILERHPEVVSIIADWLQRQLGS